MGGRFRKPPKAVPDEPASSPMSVKTPCVFCGNRLSQEDKKTHDCWSKK